FLAPDVVINGGLGDLERGRDRIQRGVVEAVLAERARGGADHRIPLDAVIAQALAALPPGGSGVRTVDEGRGGGAGAAVHGDWRYKLDVAAGGGIEFYPRVAFGGNSGATTMSGGTQGGAAARAKIEVEAPRAPLRFVSAASLFDGHDAA